MTKKDYTKNKNYELKSEQQEGVEFLLSKPRAILVFQTGLGKTNTVITALRHLYEGVDNVRGIIICPVNAVNIFKKELKGVGFKDTEIGFITREKDNFNANKHKILIMSYSYLASNFHVISDLKNSGYRVVGIVDEVHKLCASKTETRILFDNIRQYFNVIWGATATPILNDEEGLYNLISYFDQSIFGTKTAFYNNYVDFVLKDIYIKGGGGRKKKIREIKGFKNYEDLRKKLESICIIRGIEYNVQFYYLGKDITNEEAEVYEEASRGIIDDEQKDWGARMHDLQRVVNNVSKEYGLFGETSKDQLFMEVLEAVLKKGYPPIIYSEYHLTLERLHKLLEDRKSELGIKNIYSITGKVSPKDRQYVEKNLKANDVVLITSAGTQSLNLQKSNTIIFYDIPFPIGICVQVIGRVTRMDSDYDSQHVFLIYTRNTIDEYKYLNFADNADNILKLLGSATGLPDSVSNIDKNNLKRLKEKYLWHYKGGIEKTRRDNIKRINTQIECITPEQLEGKYLKARYILNTDIFGESFVNTKQIRELIPPEDVAKNLRESPFVVFRVQYINYLKRECKPILESMMKSALKDYEIVFVDNYKVGSIIKEAILELAGKEL